MWTVVCGTQSERGELIMNLSIKIFIALALAIVVGLILDPSTLPFINWWIAPIGTIFINLIKMVIVPVVFTSLIVGVTSLGDTRKLGRNAGKTIVLYLCTTAIAIIIGFVIAGIVQPGVGLEMASEPPKVKQAPGIMQVIVAMIPANPVDAMAKAQILPLIIFSLFIGVGILQVGGERAQLLSRIFDAAAEVCYKIIGMVMQIAPIGVFALLLPVVVKNGSAVLLPLLSVIICVAVGCVLHAVFVYSAMVKVSSGHSPVKFFEAMSEAMMLAFSTCSSSGTLPVNMKNVQEKLGVSREVSSFVLPLGATINMDGAAITITVMTMATAFTLGIHVDIPTAIILSLLAALSACGASGVAGGSLLLIPMACSLFGISDDISMQVVAVGFIIGVIQDSVETALNSSSDLLLSASAEFRQWRLEGKEIKFK